MRAPFSHRARMTAKEPRSALKTQQPFMVTREHYLVIGKLKISRAPVRLRIRKSSIPLRKPTP